MTIPDIRDAEIVVPSNDLKTIVGEIGAIVIAVALIVYDGELGLMAAIAIGGFLAGMNIDLSKLKRQ